MDLPAILAGADDLSSWWDSGSRTPVRDWVLIASDGIIFAAYFAIPMAMLWLLKKRPDVPFRRLFWLVGAFILACGFWHLTEMALPGHPWFRFLSLVKALTAVVSLVTVV